jgi:hypothetical protein
MTSFESIKGVLNYRRSTVPPYRDIRDRPTWELLDTLYWDNRTNPDIFADMDPANSGLEYIKFPDHVRPIPQAHVTDRLGGESLLRRDPRH